MVVGLLCGPGISWLLLHGDPAPDSWDKLHPYNPKGTKQERMDDGGMDG